MRKNEIRKAPDKVRFLPNFFRNAVSSADDDYDIFRVIKSFFKKPRKFRRGEIFPAFVGENNKIARAKIPFFEKSREFFFFIELERKIKRLFRPFLVFFDERIIFGRVFLSAGNYFYHTLQF